MALSVRSIQLASRSDGVALRSAFRAALEVATMLLATLFVFSTHPCELGALRWCEHRIDLLRHAFTELLVRGTACLRSSGCWTIGLAILQLARKRCSDLCRLLLAQMQTFREMGEPAFWIHVTVATGSARMLAAVCAAMRTVAAAILRRRRCHARDRKRERTNHETDASQIPIHARSSLHGAPIERPS